MRTPEQSTSIGGLTNLDGLEQDELVSAALYPGPGQPTPHSPIEGSAMTDRPLRFPHGFGGAPGVPPPSINPARAHWLEAHDVHTEFLDAGIGCGWFAENGNEGAVIGATEEEALTRLAQRNGWELWAEA